MRRKRHYERIVARENDERDRTAALLASLRSSAVALDADIKNEEQRTGNHDPAYFAYPIVARSMAQRRDNLEATIAVLEQRLANNHEYSAAPNWN